MITIDDGGSVQAAIEKLEATIKMLGPAREGVLVVDERSEEILRRQKEQGRDVLSWQEDEARSALEIAEIHVKRFLDGGSTDPEGAARAMWQELGEYYRDRIASKINDSVHVAKRALSERYAEWKAKKWGAGKPILVASGELRDDVKSATVEVRNK